MHVWECLLLKLDSQLENRLAMERLKPRIAVTVIVLVGILVTGVWLFRGLPSESSQQQPSSSGSGVLAEVPKIALCDLLAHPANYNQKIVRTEAYLFSIGSDLHLSDPSSCVLPHPMVGVELDQSIQIDSRNSVEKEIYNRIRGEGEAKDAKFHVVIVGRFEGPIFADARLRDKSTGKYKFKNAYRYPYRFTITRLEKAEAVSPENGQSADR